MVDYSWLEYDSKTVNVWAPDVIFNKAIGKYMMYDDESDCYYLFVSYGELKRDGVIRLEYLNQTK